MAESKDDAKPVSVDLSVGGYLTMLFLLLLGLKVTGNSSLSWLWTLSPLWIPWGLVALGAAPFLLIEGFYWLKSKLWRKRNVRS